MSGVGAASAAGTFLSVSTSQVPWFVSRGSGLVLLVALSAAAVLGVATRTGSTPRRIARFAVAELHRTLALFAVVLLALHVATAVTDPYVSIGWVAAAVPFVSHYQPLAVGLGALSVDLFGAVLVTSLVRRRLGYRFWRAVHWLAYAAWPVALAHTFTAGASDLHRWWVAAVVWASTAAVATALVARLLDRVRGPRTVAPGPGAPAGRAAATAGGPWP